MAHQRFRKRFIQFGLRDKRGAACFGKPRSQIPDEPGKHRGLSAFHELVAHRRIDGLPAGDFQQIWLAAHAGDFEEILVRQPPRPSQDRSCHQYFVVGCQPAGRFAWNSTCPTQVVAKQSQGLRIRPLYQS